MSFVMFVRRCSSFTGVGSSPYSFYLLILTMFTFAYSATVVPGELDPPKITQAPKDKSVAANHIVSFFCKASGNPLPVFRWTKNGRKLPRSRYVTQEMPHGSVLRIHTVKAKRDDAEFACIAENVIGEPATASAKLIVYPVDEDDQSVPRGYPRISKNPGLMAVEKGRPALLRCEATGYPAPSVMWLKDMIPVDMSDPRLTIMDSGNLQIERCQESDVGKYECVAENEKGVAYSHPASLYVKVRRFPPHFSIPPENMSVMPGGDVNLTCVAVGSPMPRVRWVQGPKEITQDDEVLVGRNILRLTDVRETKNYTCVASSELGTIEHTAEIKIIAPGSPPINVRARPVSSTTILVTWDKPELPNGVIRGYKVFYTLTPDIPIVFWEHREVHSNRLTTISNLKTGRTYTISVLAFSSSGQGPLSDPIQVMTTQGVPLQLRTLHGEAMTPNSISLTWSAPEETNSIVSYELYYNDSLFRQNVRISINPPVAGFTLTDLTPDTVYHIQVSAKSTSTEGAKTPTIQVRTLPFVPGQPKKVRLEAINSTAAYVEWQPPSRNERNGIIRGYQVHYIPVDDDESPTDQPRIVDIMDAGDAVVTGLDADTKYRFHVVAYTRKGGGIRSKARIVTTKGAVPSPPRSLNVELMEEDVPRVRLTWQQPRETYGPIEGYKVVWGKKESYMYAEIILAGQKYTYVTDILKKGSIYEFRVSAKNAVDFGQRAVETVRTPEGVPWGEPQNFSAVGLSETSVRLAWDLPAKDLRNGEVIMYQITYTKLSHPINVEDLNITEATVEITGLEMKTDYIFQIKAFTSRGAGPWSNKLHFRTFGQMPPAPQNVRAQKSTPTSILVFWDEPSFPVAGYKVYYSLFALPNIDLWQSIDIGPYTVTEITGLREDTVYAICVQARSVDGRLGNLSNIILATYSSEDPRRSDVVEHFHAASRTSRSVILKWEPPSKVGINSYRLRYQGRKRYKDKYGAMQVVNHPLQTLRIPGQTKELMVKNLPPNVLFSFNLSAIFQDQTSGPEAYLVAQTLIEDGVYWRKMATKDLQTILNTQNNMNVAKNVILFIGDGMGVSTVTAARILKGQQLNKTGEEEQLAFEDFPHVGLTKTYGVNYQTTDAAASATAFLSGVKTNNGVLGYDSRVKYSQCSSTSKEAEVDTILQWSLTEGKSTGIVTTTRVTHATPAAAFAHSPDRNWEGDAQTRDNPKAVGCKDVAYQLIMNNSDIKVIMGGGRRFFMPKYYIDPEKNRLNLKYGRTDNLNLPEKWKADKFLRGLNHSYVWNKEQFDQVDSNNTDYLLGLFSPSHMKFDIDRTDQQPSLADMTKKSIEILQKNEKGYFLYIEGGRIDHGHHANMAKRALTDTLAFDQAIEVAKSMTNESDTLIVVTADHSHVMVISRGNPILDVMNSQSLAPATDGLDVTTIPYGNGPGYSSVNGTRVNVTAKDTTMKSPKQHAYVPLVSETHTGEDVAMYARGPMSHLFTGVREQNFLATAMAYASCVGEDKRHCQRSVNP